MYAPRQFREERREVLIEFVRAIQFSAIVVHSQQGFSAAHLPVLVCDDAGRTRIEMHVSRANPLWRHAVGGCSALAIVEGPQAYIHPGWYETKKQTGKAVPTWNYVSVHAEGTLKVIEDEKRLLKHLEDLTNVNEAQRAQPWGLGDAPAGYIETLLGGIVGLELEVERLEGVWKMIQHHPDQNQLGVIEGLSASGDPNDRAVAGVMQALRAAADSNNGE